MLRRFFKAKSFIFHIPKPIQVPKKTYFGYFCNSCMYMQHVHMLSMHYMYEFNVLYVSILCVYLGWRRRSLKKPLKKYVSFGFCWRDRLGLASGALTLHLQKKTRTEFLQRMIHVKIYGKYNLNQHHLIVNKIIVLFIKLVRIIFLYNLKLNHWKLNNR